MAVVIGRRAVGAAFLAGMVGAVTVEVYLFAVGLASWPGTYQWIASAVRGGAAYTSTSAAWLGVVMHVAVSLAWAMAFAFVAVAWPRLLARPIPWGLAFGLLVFAVMQGAVALAGLWTAPAPTLLLHYLVDHAVFFGLPLACLYRWCAGPVAFR